MHWGQNWYGNEYWFLLYSYPGFYFILNIDILDFNAELLQLMHIKYIIDDWTDHIEYNIDYWQMM